MSLISGLIGTVAPSTTAVKVAPKLPSWNIPVTSDEPPQRYTPPPPPPSPMVPVALDSGTRMVNKADVRDGYIETARGGIPIEAGGSLTTTLPAQVIKPGAAGGTTYPVDFDTGAEPLGIFPTIPPSPGTPTPSAIGWDEFDSGLAGPDWWKALKPSEMTKETEQLANLNLLIPLLSPEDQRQVAGAIYNADPKNFAHLNPEDKDFFPPPGVGRGVREQFQDVSRAESGLAALTKLATATGTDAESQGAGTRFLRNILDQMQDFSGQGQQSRQQYMEMMGSVDPTIQGATSEQKPFQSLGRMLSQPFFSTGRLQNVRKDQEGKYVFGAFNKALTF